MLSTIRHLPRRLGDRHRLRRRDLDLAHRLVSKRRCRETWELLCSPLGTDSNFSVTFLPTAWLANDNLLRYCSGESGRRSGARIKHAILFSGGPGGRWRSKRQRRRPCRRSRPHACLVRYLPTAGGDPVALLLWLRNRTGSGTASRGLGSSGSGPSGCPVVVVKATLVPRAQSGF